MMSDRSVGLYRGAISMRSAIGALGLILAVAGGAQAGVLPVLPMLSIDKTHSGTFKQGDIGDAYAITVSNSDGGPTLSSVSVTDTLPGGLTATAISGDGWTCALDALTCTRDDVLQPGTSYPQINLIVDVSTDAPPTVTNVATLSGGYANYVDPPPVEMASDVTPITQLQLQTITFTSAAPANAVVDGPTYLATATATSGLPVVLTIDATSAAVCTISNDTVTFIGVGTCTIDANQSGDATYAPAPQVQQSFAVGSAGGVTEQTITFISAAPVDATVGGPLYLATATASSGLPVVLNIDATSATVCTLSNDTVTFIGAGACTIDANQSGDATYGPAPQVQQSFTVGSAGGVTEQTITFTSAAPVDATVGGVPYLAIATATSGLPVVLTINGTSATVCTINDGTVTFIGAGTCTIDANQGGDATYAAASQVQQAFLVGSAGGVTEQTITFISVVPANAMVGGPPYPAIATATSGLPVVLSIDGTSATMCTINNGMVTFIGAGTCTIDANQGGDATYAAATQVQQAFMVGSAAGVTEQTITFISAAPANAMVGGSTYLAIATATSGLPVVLTIDGTSATVCAINSGTVTFIGAGTCTIDANQGGDATYAAATQVQQSFVVAAETNPADHIFGDGFDGSP